METVNNPTSYDAKVPTNIRLSEDLKRKVLAEAEKRGTTIAKIVNEALEERYKQED